MSAISTSYYGDQTRWFIGVVKSTADPKAMGRVRVRIHGVHNDNANIVRDEDLPWAQVVTPVTQPGIPGNLTTTGIQGGAQVFGIFIDGKRSQIPLVLGAIAVIGGVIHSLGLDEELIEFVSTDAGSDVARTTNGEIPNTSDYELIPLTTGSNAEIIFDFIHTWLSQNGSS